MENVASSREHPEPFADALPPLVLDRQRIIHSAAFRRLQYKTQVFVAREGDHFRTRLTHTLEVAELARHLASRLNLNDQLAEVVALAHDLGHPPFGHAGERALDECMQKHGGQFEHNAHTLRVVEYLEHPYPEFRGLNLTRGVRACLAKHRTRYDQPGPHPLQDGTPPPPEGQVAAAADRLTYALHDLSDGLYAGLIDPGELRGLDLWQQAYAGSPKDAPGQWRKYLRPTIDRMQGMLVDDVVAETQRRVGSRGPQALDAALDGGATPVGLSAEMDRSLGSLGELLKVRVYKHQRVVRMDTKAGRILSAVFEAYSAEPRLLPVRFFQRIGQGDPPATAHEVIKDYVAGMTDRFCQDEHARLFDSRMDV